MCQRNNGHLHQLADVFPFKGRAEKGTLSQTSSRRLVSSLVQLTHSLHCPFIQPNPVPQKLHVLMKKCRQPGVPWPQLTRKYSGSWHPHTSRDNTAVVSGNLL